MIEEFGSDLPGAQRQQSRLMHERRMHAQANEYWLSLLDGRDMPLLSNFNPDQLWHYLDDSVLIDLTGDQSAPDLLFIGRNLREEAGMGSRRASLDDIPAPSLLAAVVRCLPEIMRHRAPVELAAERKEEKGATVLHRGILLPFADQDERMSAIYGFISWKRSATIHSLNC